MIFSVLLLFISFYLLFFNPYFLPVEVLALTRHYLFIKYVQESAGVPVPPPRVDAKVCPAAAEEKGEEKERAEKERDFRVREQIFTGSKTKKTSTVLSWGCRELGWKRSPRAAPFVMWFTRTVRVSVPRAVPWWGCSPGDPAGRWGRSSPGWRCRGFCSGALVEPGQPLC